MEGFLEAHGEELGGKKKFVHGANEPSTGSQEVKADQKADQGGKDPKSQAPGQVNRYRVQR